MFSACLQEGSMLALARLIEYPSLLTQRGSRVLGDFPSSSAHNSGRYPRLWQDSHPLWGHSNTINSSVSVLYWVCVECLSIWQVSRVMINNKILWFQELWILEYLGFLVSGPAYTWKLKFCNSPNVFPKYLGQWPRLWVIINLKISWLQELLTARFIDW